MLKTWQAYAVALLALGATRSAVAQSSGDNAAYLALVSTPIGGAAPSIAAPLIGSGGSLGWHVRYAQIGTSDLRFRHVLAGLDLSLGRSALAIDAGWNAVSCSDAFQTTFGDCKGNFLAGAQFATPIIGVGAHGSGVALGFQADVGYSKPKLVDLGNDDFAAYSAAASLPLAITASAGGTKIAPYIAPGFGWGRLSASYGGSSDSESGTRFMLGGGVRIESMGGLGLSVGAQKVFIDGGKTTIGGGFSWHGR